MDDEKKKQRRRSKAFCATRFALHDTRGFTLLYAVLMSSLLLTIGLGIFNITIKELLLSSAGRESQFAFYAADTGAECALYWDFKFDSFATSTDSEIKCGGVTMGGIVEGTPYHDTCCGGAGPNVRSEFTLDFAPEPYCVTVYVTKFEGPDRTTIESRGYNTCDPGNPRRVERTILVEY